MARQVLGLLTSENRSYLFQVTQFIPKSRNFSLLLLELCLQAAHLVGHRRWFSAKRTEQRPKTHVFVRYNATVYQRSVDM